MQNPSRPPEMYPLQSSQQPPGTVVVSVPEPPKDYIVWSMASIVCGNPLCLGLLAFYFSIKARDHKLMGDMQGAQAEASHACVTNSVALGLILLTILICIIIVAVTASAVRSYAGNYNVYNRY